MTKEDHEKWLELMGEPDASTGRKHNTKIQVYKSKAKHLNGFVCCDSFGHFRE